MSRLGLLRSELNYTLIVNTRELNIVKRLYRPGQLDYNIMIFIGDHVQTLFREDSPY